ncbi:hypothetical protein DL765_010600 [Monosporascus sp. GIB2]|nr:hypothetical protein DL765_010600 [Monosporascus sp. GIB2]
MSSLGLSSPDQNITITIVIVFPVLAFLVLCVRIAGRASSRQFGWDDGLACTAMVLSILETYFSFMFIKTNFIGINPEDIPPHDPTPGLVWNYMVQILYNPILGIVKASILLFLLRLFGQKRGARQYILWLNTANVAHMVAVLFIIVLQCIPIEKTWDLSVPGRCVDRPILFTTVSAFNISTDLLILALPLRIFIDLKIPRRTKIALMFLFLLGFIVTIMSVIRMVLLVQGLFMPLSSLDPDGNVGFATSAIEMNLAIITASTPALWPLLRSWFPRLFGVTGRDQLAGNPTARRVLSTSAMGTRLTRMRSQQSRMVRSDGGGPKLSEEEALPSALLPSNGIMQRSVVHIHYEPNPGVADGSDPGRRVEGFV